MADPQIPPPAAGGPLILLKAKTYSLIRKGLMRAILPDPNDFEIERSPAFLKFRLRPQEALEKAGAFFTLITVESEGPDNGDTLLQGGSVTGGEGSYTWANYKVTDAETGPTAGDGTILYAKVDVSGTVADGVLLPGIEITGGGWGTASNLPPNDVLTAAVSAGSLYYEIGRWVGQQFFPAGAGNLKAAGCIGSYNIQRA